MKKILSYFCAISFAITSFFISKQTTFVVKETDEIMLQIKEENKKYEENPINAKIEGNTIIPGYYGKKININKSYQEMKKNGKYNPANYVYEELKPEISIDDIYDKYIVSGNRIKNIISIIFTVSDNDNISEIIKIVENNNIKVTFFIDNDWLYSNNSLTLTLIEKGHNIGILSNNLDYEYNEFIWMNNIIKKIGNQKINYCYAEEENQKNIKICAKQKNYTIKPNIIIKTSPLKEIKKTIQSGSIISIKANQISTEELEIIINYIKSRGFSIENLEKNLTEKNRK